MIKRSLLSLSLLVALSSAAVAQCSGNFPANTFCGSITGGPPAPRGVTASVINAAAGSVIGNAGTASGLASDLRAPVLGLNGTAQGSLGLRGSTSGTVTIQPGAAASGTFNFNLPTSAGTSGQPLLSGGGGSTAMTFGTLGPTAGGTGLSSFAQGTVLSATAANTWAATATPVLGIPGTTLGTLGFAGNTSGTATVRPQAVAGSPTLLLPNTSGTFAVNATSPLSLSATTGMLTCTECWFYISSGTFQGKWALNNATFDGTHFQRTDASKVAFAASMYADTNIPGDPGTAGIVFWVANPQPDGGGGYITQINDTYSSTYGWNLMQGWTQYKDAVIGGYGLEIDGNGTSPYGRFAHTLKSATAFTGLLSNFFLDFSNVDSNVQPSWMSGIYGDAFMVGRSAAGDTTGASLVTLLNISSAGNATLKGTLGLQGSSSGTATITAQATAGTPTLTLPNTSGTFAVGASSPLVLSATTGGLTCPTCVTSSGGGAITGTAPISVSAAGVVSITSPLPLTNGGTAASLTASNGGIVYSTASALAILAGTATANQHLASGASGAPAWTTATYPATAAAGTLLAAGTSNVISATATPTLGANGGTGGQITLSGSTSGTVALKVAAAAGTGTIFQFPADNGTNNYVLSTNGSGVTSWVSAGGTGTVTSVQLSNGTGINVATTSGANPCISTCNLTIGLTTARQTLPTTQVFTSGSGTYTTPANALWIEILLVGGGGGGDGGNSGGAGSNGGDTCWNTSGSACTSPVYQAGKGSGGVSGGGTVSGSGTCNVLSQSGGGGGPGAIAHTTANGTGGPGGSSSLGGQGPGGASTSTGQAGVANSGSGGGGGGTGAATSTPGGGGSAGATCRTIIGSPAGTYTYTVGAGGAGGSAGSSGGAGGAGAAGRIVVIEHYGS